MIKYFQPIELHTDNKSILAEFDKFTANKNLYAKGNSTQRGFLYKKEHIKDLPSYITNSKYDYSSEETGKKTAAHKDVKFWHYFKGKVETDKGTYDITINIRDKGDKQFVYEIAFR